MEGNLHLKIEEGFLRYRFGGLIFGGAYTWRGLFSEFYGNSTNLPYTMTVISCLLYTSDAADE